MAVTALRFETRDPEVGLPKIGELFASRPRLEKTPDDFRLSVGAVGDGRLSASRVAMNGRFTITTEVGSAMVMRMRRGSLASPWAPERAAEDTRLFFVPPGVAVSSISESPDLEVVGLDPVGLTRLAREYTGDSHLRLVFARNVPISPALEKHWSTTAQFVITQVLRDPELWGNPIIREEAFRTLAVATLQLFPNNTLDELEEREEHALPTSVRRALQYIDDHLESSVSIGDIAGAARLSVRGLQAAFRRQLETTPSDYLRRARLSAAHRALESAGPEATVQGIARHWGFAHAGRFASEYRRVFGEAPSATLHG